MDPVQPTALTAEWSEPQETPAEAELFCLKEEKRSYSTQKHTAGLFVASCLHAVCYGFHHIVQPEGRKDLLKVLYERFSQEVLDQLHVLYDFNCQAGEYLLNRVPHMFSKTRLFIDSCLPQVCRCVQVAGIPCLSGAGVHRCRVSEPVHAAHARTDPLHEAADTDDAAQDLCWHQELDHQRRAGKVEECVLRTVNHDVTCKKILLSTSVVRSGSIQIDPNLKWQCSKNGLYFCPDKKYTVPRTSINMMYLSVLECRTPVPMGSTTKKGKNNK